jgi:excisionase family DNA binding protein
MEKLLSLSEAAKILGVTTQTLRNWDRAGKIKTIRTLGAHRRISVSEIEKLQQTKEENND